MSDKVVQVRDAIKEFAQAMERRARYGHKRVVAEEVMASRFMSVAEMFAGMDRNLAKLQSILHSARGRRLTAEEMIVVDDSAADVANYLRMACEKIRAAKAQ
jgi:hypothetical protein